MARTFELPVVLKAIDKISGPLRKVGGKLNDFGKSTRKVGRQLSVGVTAPVVAFGALTISSAAQFETGMNRVRALTGAAEKPIAALTEQAKDLGESTVFSASEAAGAMGFLAQAGFEADKILGAMPGTLTLAAAAQSDLAETADIASNILSGYQLEVSQTDRLVNVLTGTFTNSNTSLEQLGEAMKIAGPVAASMGIELEQTAAVMGVLGNAGFQASLAGTSLRGALSKLGDPTAEAAAALGRLQVNVSSFRDSSGNITDLSKVVRELERTGAGAVDLLQIFGQRAGPAMAALVGQGADAIDSLQVKLSNTDAAKIAAIQMEGAAGASKQLASAFEGLQLAIADSGLLGDFTELVKSLTAWVRQVSSSNPELLRMATIVAAVAAAVGPLLIGLGFAIQGVGGLSTGLAFLLPKLGTVVTFIATKAIPTVWALGSAFLATPFGMVVAGIAAVIAAGVLLVRNWDKVRAFFGGIWDWMSEKVAAFSDFVVDKITALTDWLPDWVRDKLGLDEQLAVSVGGEAVSEANAVAGAGSRGPRGGDRSRVEVDFRNLPPGSRVFTDAGPDADLDVTSGFALGGA